MSENDQSPLRMPDRWQDVDLPVLVTAARLLTAKQGGYVRDAEVAEALAGTGITEAAVKMSLADLSQTYFDGLVQRFGQATPPLVNVKHLTDEGRRAVGLWPSTDRTEALLAALNRVADEAPDAEEASKVRRLVGGLGSLSRETFVQVTAATAAALATGR